MKASWQFFRAQLAGDFHLSMLFINKLNLRDAILPTAN